MNILTKGLNSSLKLPIEKSPLSFRGQSELVFRKFKEWVRLVSYFEAVSGTHFQIGARSEFFSSFSQAFETIEESTLLAADSSQDILVVSVLLKVHQTFLELMAKMSVFEDRYKSRIKMYIEVFMKVLKEGRYKSSLR
jgi:RNAse (barnase) inhibitor barstar